MAVVNKATVPGYESFIRAPKRYGVLVHGALESFAEALAYWVLGKSVKNWTFKRKVTRCTLSLLLYHKSPAIAVAKPASVFDNVRLALDEAKSKVSIEIYENHGVTIDHLRSLFMPSDPVLVASLDSLVKMRHQWAHHDHRHAKVLKSAKDAQTTVSDCVSLAQKLNVAVTNVRP